MYPLNDLGIVEDRHIWQDDVGMYTVIDNFQTIEYDRYKGSLVVISPVHGITKTMYDENSSEVRQRHIARFADGKMIALHRHNNNPCGRARWKIRLEVL